MIFVPVVPPSSSQPPSTHTREVANLLTRVLEEYRKAHPSVSDAELRAALRLAARGGGGREKRMVAFLVWGLVAVLGVGIFTLTMVGGEGGGGGMEGFVLVAVFLVVLVVVAVLKSRSP